MPLTGKIRYRLGFGGKIVLQVQDTEKRFDRSLALSPTIDRMREGTFWRDANFIDVQALATGIEP